MDTIVSNVSAPPTNQFTVLPISFQSLLCDNQKQRVKERLQKISQIHFQYIFFCFLIITDIIQCQPFIYECLEVCLLEFKPIYRLLQVLQGILQGRRLLFIVCLHSPCACICYKVSYLLCCY